MKSLNQVLTLVGTLNYLLILLVQAAPATHDVALLDDASAPISGSAHDDDSSRIDSAPAAAAAAATATAAAQAPIAQHHDNLASPVSVHKALEAASAGLTSGDNHFSRQVDRRQAAKGALPHGAELETQETGYHLPPSYPSATESDYGYDAGKNSYGKQASDWSLYDQGNHGLYDKYGDKAWKDQGHNDQSSHGKHDSYGNSYNSHGSGHGSGYYSRDRGYGYEKHYAYDKEVASKHHADNHNNYGSQHGLHDHYGNSASNSHANQGHDKYGQASRYGNHGYGKRGSQLAANHDYGHNQNKGHYYAHSSPPQTYQHSYSSHVPTYRSTYSDYGPQIGYPSSYPSYY